MGYVHLQNQRRIRSRKAKNTEALKFTAGAYKYLEEQGISQVQLSGIIGTGKNGNIKKSDVVTFLNHHKEKE